MKKLISIFIALLLMPIVLGQETATVPIVAETAGVTPENPFWVIDRFFEKLALSGVADERKAILRIKYADERLAEIEQMQIKLKNELKFTTVREGRLFKVDKLTSSLEKSRQERI